MAVMVDLGWPWWVGLIIAFSVAAVCAVALVKTTGGIVRGVLGLLVVEGVVLGAIAPFVMSTPSSAATNRAGQQMSSSAPSSTAVIHVIERAPPPDMKMVGGVLTFANLIFDGANEKQIGRDQGFCLHIELAKAAECIWTTILPSGDITAEGPESDTGSRWVFAITGGTGQYQNARGWLEERVHNKAGTEFDVIFHLTS